jgi:hypothetical protein
LWRWSDIVYGGCDKNLRRFCARYHVWYLQTRTTCTSYKSGTSDILVCKHVHDNMHETFSNFYHSLHILYHFISTSFIIFGSWFVSIVRNNVHETFSNFYHSLHIRYHFISISFMIFGLRLSASSWSCFVNKMFKIWGLFVDIDSQYTQ